MRIKLTWQLGHSQRGTLPLAVELDPDAATGFVHGLIPDNGGEMQAGRGDARGPAGEERPTRFGGEASSSTLGWGQSYPNDAGAFWSDTQICIS